MTIDQVAFQDSHGEYNYYEIGAKAENVKFNNAGTTLRSTNVQDAIIEAAESGGGGGGSTLLQDTTANWNGQATLLSRENYIYIYTDYSTVDGVTYPAMKVGDGKAYLIDLPFVDCDAKLLRDHLADYNIHITNQEREKWNDKVRCYIDSNNVENLIFTTN